MVTDAFGLMFVLNLCCHYRFLASALIFMAIVCRLVMGTRSGDLDPAIPLFLMNKLGVSAKDMDSILNKKSGLLGVSGYSDLRAIIDHKVSRSYHA